MKKNSRRPPAEAKKERERQLRGVMERILNAFETGDVPAILKRVWLNLADRTLPMAQWSPLNQFIVAISGATDARAFGQWKDAGRSVRKGEKAFRILAPLVYKAKEDDPLHGIKEGDPVIRGFKAVAVFDVSQTEGEPLPNPYREEHEAFLAALPLRGVAEKWGIQVVVERTPGGFASYGGGTIRLATDSKASWLHELTHAAEDRLGALKVLGQDPAQEVVAQLGASTLAEFLGLEHESDRGFSWRYIQHYAKDDPLGTARALLERTMAAVRLIVNTAAELEQDAIHEPRQLLLVA